MYSWQVVGIIRCTLLAMLCFASTTGPSSIGMSAPAASQVSAARDGQDDCGGEPLPKGVDARLARLPVNLPRPIFMTVGRVAVSSRLQVRVVAVHRRTEGKDGGYGALEAGDTG